MIGETIDRLGREERGFEAAEHRDTLSRALACLDDRSRRALRLRAEADLTTPEIAACMGLSPSQAGRLVAKSLRRLRAALDEEEQVPPSVASRSVAVRAVGAATTFAVAAEAA